MRYAIKHEVPGRIRFDLRGKIPERDSVALEESFLALRCVTKCVAYPKAGSLAVTFESPDGGTLELARELVASNINSMVAVGSVEKAVINDLASHLKF
jgi:hypothetical protein